MKQGQVNIKFRLGYNQLLEQNFYVARLQTYSKLEDKSVVSYAAKASNVPEETVRAVYDALFDAFDYFLCNGHSFLLPEIGTFSLSVQCKSNPINAANPVVGSDAVRKLGINFLPVPDLKTIVSSTGVQTTAENPNALTEFSTPMVRGISFNGVKLFHSGLTTSSATADDAAGLNKVEVNGYNMDQVSSITITGTNGNEQVTKVVTLSPTNKSMLVAAGQYDGNFFDNITKFTIGGVDYLLGQQGQQSQNSLYMGSSVVYSGGYFATGGGNFRYVGTGVQNATITIDGEAANVLQRQPNQVTFYNGLSAGQHTIVCGSDTYTFTITNQAVPSIASLTANNVAVANGGSSTITPGNTYNFVAVGSNLGGVTQGQISVPNGSTISNFSASANRIEFTMTAGSNAGTISIASLFTVNVTIYTPSAGSASVTSINGVSNGGTIFPNGNSGTLTIRGTNLGELNASCFGCQAGETLSFSNYVQDGENYKISYAGVTSSTQHVVVYSDSSKTTSIFSAGIIYNSGSGYGD